MKSSTISPKETPDLIWSEIELRAWQRPREISVSDWVDEHRYLDPLTSAEPGQWMTDRTPYLKGIMDAFIDPMVEDITIMASTQVGKTESMFNMLGYAIDQDPAPTLWVMPREPDARAISSDRIEPMIRLSPALKAHLTENEDDITRLEIKLDRMVIYFAGANSPAALAQKPIRYLFLDETDKYPRFSGREADPIKLATERTRTFWNRKIVKCSTPTTREGYIFREYERSDKCRYHVPCPHCGRYQALTFGRLKWPEEERDPEIIKEEKLGFYECAECKGKIRDADKHKIMQEGVWVPEGLHVDKTGKVKDRLSSTTKKGFWINALYSPWISFSEIAAEFLRSRDSIELLMNFVNSWLAEIWEEKSEETKEEKILEKQTDYPEGLVPTGAVVLTAGVDVQKDHFYLVIRGWGIGEESWLIRAARVEAWEDVVAVLFKTEYKRASGDPFKVRLSCVDSGFRTDEVYELCRRWRDVARAVKGENHLSGVPYRPTRIDRNPKTGAVIEGGLSLWRLDTSLYKDKITRMVGSSPGDPSQWHVFRGVSEEYVRQFCAEHKVLVRDRKSGRVWEEWKKKSAGSPNHYWDAEVYAAAAADMLRVSSLREEGQSIPFIPKKTDEDMRSGAWLRTRKGWIRR